MGKIRLPRKTKQTRKFDGKTYHWYGFTGVKATIPRRKAEAKSKGLKHARVVKRKSTSGGTIYDIYAKK